MDGDGFLPSASGARMLRIDNATLWVYDRLARREIPLTLADLWTMAQTQKNHAPAVRLD